MQRIDKPPFVIKPGLNKSIYRFPEDYVSVKNLLYCNTGRHVFDSTEEDYLVKNCAQKDRVYIVCDDCYQRVNGRSIDMLTLSP